MKFTSLTRIGMLFGLLICLPYAAIASPAHLGYSFSKAEMVQFDDAAPQFQLLSNAVADALRPDPALVVQAFNKTRRSQFGLPGSSKLVWAYQHDTRYHTSCQHEQPHQLN